MIGITFGLVVLNLVGLPVSIIIPDIVESGDESLLTFSSVDELRDFLNQSYSSYPYYYYLEGTQRTMLATDSAKTGGATDYSGTNIQVEGVDEADIIKTDGQYIYMAVSEKVLIIKAYPADNASIVSEIKLNSTASGIYVNNDRLIVLETGYGSSPFYSEFRISMPVYYNVESKITIYDIEDRENPVKLREVAADGSLFESRMVGDYVYILITQPAYILEGEVILPLLQIEGQIKETEATEIYYTNTTDYYYEYTTIIAVNVQEETDVTTETFLFGSARNIYVSLNNIYVAMPNYALGTQTTEIHRIQMKNNNITYKASGEVPGYVLNQFSMDEYDEHFRIATTLSGFSDPLGQTVSTNNVYVLDLNLTVVGELEDLAPGERIYSARFMGERCYVVTFKKVDPLFVISLADPASPTVLGKLKIPGYSDYLHPYDENHLIGIGKETIYDEERDITWYQGVKISLFDVSDVENPIEQAKFEIGDRGTDSPVLRDHKALLFDRERNLLVIPVLEAIIDESKFSGDVPPNTHGEFVYQGAYVFNITTDDINLRGRITHLDNDTDLLKSGYYFHSEYSVERCLYIEDVLYSISDKKIKMNNLANLEEINTVELP
jgi:uncharacterized secreted protein with C-terminal beta-propeller domain